MEKWVDDYDKLAALNETWSRSRSHLTVEQSNGTLETSTLSVTLFLSVNGRRLVRRSRSLSLGIEGAAKINSSATDSHSVYTRNSNSLQTWTRSLCRRESKKELVFTLCIYEHSKSRKRLLRFLYGLGVAWPFALCGIVRPRPNYFLWSCGTGTLVNCNSQVVGSLCLSGRAVLLERSQ